jgi:hypothetical protein
MGNELDVYVYNYDTRGDDGCPLLVLTLVDESRHVFRWGRGGATPLQPPLPLGFRVGLGDNDLTTIQPRPQDTPFKRNNQIE